MNSFSFQELTQPLVLWNRGFTVSAFFGYKVRYQHALHSISGLDRDEDYLIFLACVLRSSLARYFVFHTAASVATERDQVNSHEALRLPFFLPDSEAARPNAADIVSRTASRLRRFSEEMDADAATLLKKMKRSKPDRLFDDDGDEDAERKERDRWLQEWRGKAERLQAELNPLIYEYFGIISAAERALIEDTVEIFDHSDTPASFDAARIVPTLQPLDAAGLEPYASMLTNTLNGWASGGLRVLAVGGVDTELGLGLVELRQTDRES